MYHFSCCFFLQLYSNFTCNTETTWVMRINWKATIIKLLTLIPIYTHSLLTDIHWSKWLNHENHICELTVKEISIEASSQHWTLLKKWKSEYLHKVSDVYHNNYLMQCLKVIYVDGNRSLIHKRELSPWYISVPAEKRLTF